MKPASFTFFLFALIFSVQGVAQNQWIIDDEMQFKIAVPNTYQQNQFWEGTDKILAVVSPDENVAVRVRAMPVNAQFTTDILQQVFEENILSNAQELMKEDGDLNGIPARAVAYTWTFNNTETVVGAYYIIQNGFAYVVWSIVPRSLLQQRSAESDAITNTFQLTKNKQTSSGGLLSGIGNENRIENTTPEGYKELVSDDACIEHLFPGNFELSSKEEGQSIWEDGSGVKMIVQTIYKQGTFESFMQSQTESISNQGADVIKKEFKNSNGNQIYDYDYEYGSTLFNYVAIEGNNVYYLLGFVGDKLKQGTINKHATTAQNSLKRIPCAGN